MCENCFDEDCFGPLFCFSTREQEAKEHKQSFETYKHEIMNALSMMEIDCFYLEEHGIDEYEKAEAKQWLKLIKIFFRKTNALSIGEEAYKHQKFCTVPFWKSEFHRRQFKKSSGIL